MSGGGPVEKTRCQGHPKLPEGTKWIPEEWERRELWRSEGIITWATQTLCLDPGRARNIKHPLNLGVVPSQNIPFMTSDKKGSFITAALEVNCLFWSDFSLSQLSYCESHQISKGGIKNNSFPDPFNSCKYQLSPRSHNEPKVGRGRCHKPLFTQRQEVINDLRVLWNLSGFS